MSVELHIIRLALDRRQLMRLAARHHFPRALDEGYLLHAGLAELFASSHERANVPLLTFAADETAPQARADPATLYLLAYSDLSAADLVSLMGPARSHLLRDCVAKPMPSLAAGARAGFRVRVCPVVRTRQPSPQSSSAGTSGIGRLREVDALLLHPAGTAQTEGTAAAAAPFEGAARTWSARQRAYGAWLSHEVGRFGAAQLQSEPRLASFRLTNTYRRGAPGDRPRRRPDAVLEGALTVSDSTGFDALLRRGIGRHRAFGFGMLLLCPAEE